MIASICAIFFSSSSHLNLLHLCCRRFPASCSGYLQIPPIFFIWLIALQIIIQSQTLLSSTSGPSLWLFLHPSPLCAFSIRRQHITHSKDSGRHSVRIKLLQIRKLLSHTNIQNRFSGHRLDGKCRTASGITV